MKMLRVVLALGAVGVLAACGGGAGGVSKGSASGLPPVSGAGKNVQAQIRIFVPTAAGTMNAGRRKALSVAYTTAGISVAVYSSPRASHPTAIVTAAFDVSATSANCAAGSSPRTCTFTIALPGTGSDDFVVTTYDAAPVGGAIPGSAKQLGIGVDPAVAISSGTNAVNFTIDGVVASVAILPTFTSMVAVNSVTQPVNVQALDADQNTIVGDAYVDANGNPVSIALAVAGSGSENFTMTPASISSPSPNGVTLSYNSTALSASEFANGIGVFITATPSNSAAEPGQSGLISVPPGTRLDNVSQSAGSLLALTIGPDRNLWYTVSSAASAIGTMPLNGAYTQFTTPSANVVPAGITSGSDGNIWFTEEGVNQIGMVNLSNDVVTEYLSGGSAPVGITTGHDGNLWYALSTADCIGTMSPSTQAITTYAIPTVNSDPQQLVLGPDNNVWFTEIAGNKIGRITTAGVISEYTISTPTVRPGGIVVGPDGALWFVETDPSATNIGRITTAGVISQLPLPAALVGSTAIATGSDGNLWLAADGYFGRVTPTGTVTVYPTGRTQQINDMISGPDGNLYYVYSTGGTGNAIGEIVL